MGANDRYQIVNAPPRSPGCCFFCKSNSRGPFVDTGVDDPFIGTFYICFGCLDDMAVARSEVEPSEPLPEPVVYHDDQFIVAFAALKGSFDGLDHLLASRSLDYANGTIAYGSAAVPTNPVGEEQGGVSPDKPAKQVNRAPKQQGRDDVPSDSGDGPGDSGFVLPDL